MDIKAQLKKIVLGKKASSDAYINHLRKIGAFVGERTTFFSPHQISIDEQYPWLIEIGDDVQITAGVRILTHDYSWSVLKKCYGPILGAAGKVKIGNNVFVGSNSVILGGTEIGDNVIIGAGSVVKGMIPDNCVAVGNPCKIKMSLEEFCDKRKQAQLEEATVLAQTYYRRTGKTPPKELFHEFFFLFEDGSQLPAKFEKKMKLTNNYEQSMNCIIQSNMFKSYEEFMAYAMNEKELK